MLDTFPVAIIAGGILGYLAGLGVGGGSLLMLWLTVALGTDYETARAINLMFFLAAAGAVTFFRWRKKSLSFAAVLPAIIAGVITTAISAWFSNKVDQEILKKIFGSLLVVTGIKELLYRPRKAR